MPSVPLIEPDKGVVGPTSIAEKRKKAVRGAIFSEFIDMFDVYLPVVILAPMQSYFIPGGISGEYKAILESLVFVTTLIGRPLGALLFGRIADRYGRRSASIISSSGFACVTMLIAFIPGYASIGIASYWILVTLRFVDGIFLGGGYTGALPLAMEYTERSKRTLVGGIILCGFPAAYVVINIVAFVVFTLFPVRGEHATYTTWGWRIPFVIGAILSALLVLYYVHKVEESEVWSTTSSNEPRKTEIRSRFTTQAWKNLAQVLLMMTGFWLAQYVLSLYLPANILLKALHLSLPEMTQTLMFSYTSLCFGLLAVGALGRWFGRRTILATGAALTSTIGAFLLYTLISAESMTFNWVVAVVCALNVTVTSCWAALVAYINERFATGVRATGFGVGYSLSIIIPSFYAFYLRGLSEIVTPSLAPVILLIIGGAIACVGALIGPETRDVVL